MNLKSIIRFIYFFLFLQLIFGCKNEEEKTFESLDSRKVVVEDNKASVPDGEFVKNHPNGAVLVKGKILNNEREGLWTSYYNTSVKQSESTYKSGVLHGRTASFYRNGQVRYIGYFLGGKKDGKWEFYNEDGTFLKSELYVKGKLSE